MSLPTAWKVTKLQELTTDISYGYTASSTLDPVGPKMLRITDIQDSRVDWDSVPYCVIAEDKLEQYRLSKYDLLFARTGATVGKSFLVKSDPPDSVYASYLIRVRTTLPSITSFLAYFFNSRQYWQQITDFSAGIGQPNVNGTKLKGLDIPLAPLAEQKVIADKLDSLLARVETTKARLDRIPEILKRFRQSVLAAAVSGRLTEEWRSKNSYKKVDVQTVQNKNFIDGLTHGNFGKKLEVSPEITEEELKLVVQHVDDWPLIRLGSLCACVVPNRDKPKKFSGGYHWLLTPNFSEQSIRIDYSNIEKGLSKEEVIQYKAKLVKRGNVIMTCVGRVGLSAVLEEDAIINQQLHAFLVNDFISAEYLAYCIRANTRFFHAKATSTTVNYLNKTACNSLPIALPSIEEQKEIVRRVEELFAYADEVEKKAQAASERVNNLTQSILAKAFRGELTKDWRAANPDLISGENSAEALLEKIKAEREALKPKKKTRPKKAKG